MSRLGDYSKKLTTGKELLIIIIAAILIELVSAAQYYSTYRMLEKQLEERAENELTFKAILVRNTLNSAEDVLKNHLWDIKRNLCLPDSMFGSVERLVSVNRHVRGGFMAYVPDFFAEKGRLFEPYALVTADGISVSQIGGEAHDYTERPFYQMAIASDGGIWVDPYEDAEGAHAFVTSYAVAVPDADGKTAGVAGVDMSLDWLSDTLNSRHIFPSSFNLLLTEAGIPIALPPTDRVSAQTSDYIVRLVNDGTFSRTKSRSGRSTLVRFKSDGKKGTLFYANMRGKPHWQIAVVCHDDEVYGELKALRVHILLLILLAVGILLFIIRRFMQSENRLKEKTMEQERMAGELSIASGIQQALLPSDDEALANTEDLSIKGLQIPAKAVGGDLYNAFVRDDKLFFCIGDVSGKGVPAALVMAIVQSMFRTVAARETNPANIMTQLNETVCRNNKENFFVTLFAGVLDLPSGRLRFCNAGHDAPFIIREPDRETSPADCRMMQVTPNLPVGVFDDTAYEMQETHIEKGSAVFLYTDGLTEARNAQRKQFRKDRLQQVLAGSRTTEPRVLVEKAVDALNRFTEGTEQADDLTILSFRYTPREAESLILDEHLTLENDVRQVEQLSTFVKTVTDRLGIGKPLAGQLRLAVEEAVVNVMQYAYPAGRTGTVSVRAASDGRRLKFTVTDSGIPFNPTGVQTADTTLPAEERPVGGLGILLVRKLMDSINYERIDGKNVLTLRKDYAE